MRKTVLLLIAFLATTVVCRSQDLLTKTNGEIIKIKVVDAGFDSVKFHIYNDPDSKIYLIATTSILSIVYENGSKQTFHIQDTKEDVKTLNQQNIKSGDQSSNKQADTYMIGGTIICQNKLMETNEMIHFLKDNSTKPIWRMFIGGTIIRKSSNYFMIPGISILLVGGMLSEQNPGKGIPMLFFGAGLTMSSIAMHIVGKSFQRKSINKYSSTQGTAYNAKLNFGVSPCGLGLTLNF